MNFAVKILNHLSNNPYSNALKNVRTLLDYDQKRRSFAMLLLLISNAFIDVFGLAFLIPITKIALEPSLIETNEWVTWSYHLLLSSSHINFLLKLSLLLLLVFIIKNTFSLIVLYIQSKFAFNIALRIGQKQFQFFIEQGFLHIKSVDAGHKIYNIANIPYLFAVNYLLQLLIFTTEFIVVCIIFVGLLCYSPPLLFITLLLVIPTFILIYSISKNTVKRLGNERNIIYPRLHSFILESLDAYENIKLSNNEQKYLEGFSTEQKNLNRIDVLLQGIFQNLSQKSNEIIMGCGFVGIFAFAYFFPNYEASMITIFAIFGGAAIRVMPSYNKMMNALIIIKNHAYLIDVLKPIENKKLYTFPSVSKLNFDKTIQLKDISYNYPKDTKCVLDQLSLTIKKGETIGFIGESGSGKTTLIHLILRFLTETEGSLLVDGIPINQENEAAFQKNIGFVQQNVFIKNGTITENIAFGESPEKINIEKLQKAIDQAMLKTFVNENPKGLSMQLGENGARLSGGQKQRIGIARALYKDADILIFDEATSALDMDTEKVISSSIAKLAQLDKTILIIAHRITTLNSCDRIYDMKNGKIDKTYSYTELFEEKLIE